MKRYRVSYECSRDPGKTYAVEVKAVTQERAIMLAGTARAESFFCRFLSRFYHHHRLVWTRVSVEIIL